MSNEYKANYNTVECTNTSKHPKTIKKGRKNTPKENMSGNTQDNYYTVK